MQNTNFTFFNCDLRGHLRSIKVTFKFPLKSDLTVYMNANVIKLQIISNIEFDLRILLKVYVILNILY